VACASPRGDEFAGIAYVRSLLAHVTMLSMKHMRPARPEPTVNVLIVDDDNTIRDLLRAALSVEEKAGHVWEAADGSAAVQATTDHKPDVIVLDYSLPDGDGATTAEEIRVIHPEAHIVAYSGLLQAKPEWADDYYVKGDLPDLDAILQAR
jgi:CheY-like chemotaxis protein